MLNEKYNSHSSWRTELEQLSALPGEEKADMNAAWEKLNTRLTLKKGNKKSFWYWMAAASVVVIITIGIITGGNKKGIHEQNLVETKQPVKKDILKAPGTETIHETTFKTAFKKNTIVSPVPNKIHVIKSQPVIKDAEPVVKIITEKDDSLSLSSIIPQTKTRPIVFPALKKKLPVIHINDLEKPVAPVEAVAGNDEHSFFRVRLFSRTISQGSPAENNENSNSLKIKLSPQN